MSHIYENCSSYLDICLDNENTNNPNKVYVLISQWGEYEDYTENVVAVSHNLEKLTNHGIKAVDEVIENRNRTGYFPSPSEITTFRIECVDYL